MTRLLITTSLVITLFSSTLFAAETISPLPAAQGPLTAGKPAGVKKAQAMDSTTMWVIGLGILAAGLTVALTSGEKEGTMKQAEVQPTTTT